MSDLSNLFNAEEKERRWRAERESATARLELAMMRKNIMYLISQHEPVGSTGLNREMLRIVFRFVEHGDLKRLMREIEERVNASKMV